MCLCTGTGAYSAAKRLSCVGSLNPETTTTKNHISLSAQGTAATLFCGINCQCYIYGIVMPVSFSLEGEHYTAFSFYITCSEYMQAGTVS